jgi:hypothetical protein
MASKRKRMWNLHFCFLFVNLLFNCVFIFGLVNPISGGACVRGDFNASPYLSPSPPDLLFDMTNVFCRRFFLSGSFVLEQTAKNRYQFVDFCSLRAKFMYLNQFSINQWRQTVIRPTQLNGEEQYSLYFKVT